MRVSNLGNGLSDYGLGGRDPKKKSEGWSLPYAQRGRPWKETLSDWQAIPWTDAPRLHRILWDIADDSQRSKSWRPWLAIDRSQPAFFSFILSKMPDISFDRLINSCSIFKTFDQKAVTIDATICACTTSLRSIANSGFWQRRPFLSWNDSRNRSSEAVSDM